MMELFVVGLSHHTAPVELREHVASSIIQSAESVQTLLQKARLEECVLVSTCNRVEVYGYTNDLAYSTQVIRERLSHTDSTVMAHLYEHSGVLAIRHVFRVASSLDSMVIGEPQILGQVKKAMLSAQTSGALRTVLGRAFQHALQAAKQIRAETAIAAGAVSVSSVGVDLASKIFGDLNHRQVLLIGAGKMGESAAKKLTDRGAELFVVNRSAERGASLAKRFRGVFVPYEHLQEKLAHVDIAIASTASQQPIIDVEMMNQVVKIRRHRPIFFIDIAVPRNIDPMVGKSDSVYVYDLDDLQKLSQENLRVRRSEIAAAEHVLETHVEKFEQWRRSLQLSPTIAALRTQLHTIVHDEVLRLGKGMDKSKLDYWSDSIVNKLLNRPLQMLKTGESIPDLEQEAAVIRKLFGLDDDVKGAS